MFEYVKISSGENEKLSQIKAFFTRISVVLFIFSTTFFTVLGLFSSQSFASYLIELNSGTQFITDHYWEEGDQVKFYLLGGTAGVSKKLIKLIKETDKPVEDEELEITNQAGPSPRKASEDRAAQEEVKAESPPITEDQKKEYLRQKETIISDLDKAGLAFQEAKKQNDKKEMRIQRANLLKLFDDMQTLLDEVKTANGGERPEWWPDNQALKPKSSL